MDPSIQIHEEDECPVCHNTLPQDSNASEAHVATCVENQLFRVEDNKRKSAMPSSKGAQLFNVIDDPGNSDMPSSNVSLEAQPVVREEDQCPVCHTFLFSKAIGESESAREAHVMACLDALDAQPSASVSEGNSLAPPYSNPPSTNGAPPQFSANKAGLFSKAAKPLSQVSDDITVMGNSNGKLMKGRDDHKFRGLRGLFSSLGAESKSPHHRAQERIAKASKLMYQRWGPPGSPVYEIAMRYMKATRMMQYWEAMGAQHPRTFAKYLDKGYMEPIPTVWVQTRQLAFQYPEGSYWETPAEKRLYYLLNNGVMPDGSRHRPMRPLNIIRDRNTIIRRGNERNARQQRIDSTKLVTYRSPGDIFHSDKRIRSHEYSAQVTNTVYEARTRALHELADGILHGTDHLETMLLIDVSGSMTWDPHSGVIGPDGVRRYHDQPSNILLVKHLVHRVLHHMIPRAQKEHPNRVGIDTVTFSTLGHYIGQLSATNFHRDWYSKVRLGGGTQVMQGWQVVKQSYFQHQHATHGHGRYDPVYGWQPTPGMPKLSLLVFLDGEAMDMDEFELELLGETWAYVTVALVGMENCPHHHSHAIELERVARFNPHVGFFDVHGRVCERLVVEDLLGSVYPVDPPGYSEILKPEYDLPPEKLPAYVA